MEMRIKGEFYKLEGGESPGIHKGRRCAREWDTKGSPGQVKH